MSTLVPAAARRCRSSKARVHAGVGRARWVWGGGGGAISRWSGRLRRSSRPHHFESKTLPRRRRAFTFPGRETGMPPSESDIVSDVKTRDDALALLHQYTKSDSLRKHALAVEQAMKACARKYAPSEDQERRGICWLLHDFDYEEFPNADQHPYVGSKILEEAGFDPELRHAIMGHAPYTGVPRDTIMARAL